MKEHNSNLCTFHLQTKDKFKKSYILSNCSSSVMSFFSGQTLSKFVFAQLLAEHVCEVFEQYSLLASDRQSYLLEDLFVDCDRSELISIDECFHTEQFPLKEHVFTPDASIISSEKCVFEDPTLLKLLSSVQQLPVGTELALHTDPSEQGKILISLIQFMRRRCLPSYEFENCNIYRGTLGNQNMQFFCFGI